jgi:hypothetical protein
MDKDVVEPQVDMGAAEVVMELIQMEETMGAGEVMAELARLVLFVLCTPVLPVNFPQLV